MKENGKYRMLYSCIGMLCSITFGYNAFYLSAFGFSAGAIGVISAVFGILIAVCQPFLGRLIDRSKRITWKMILISAGILAMADLIALFFCKERSFVAFLFGMLTLFANCILTLANIACFYYERKGIHIDFGFGRGMCSLFYGISAFIMGRLTARYGTQAVLISGLIVMIVLVLISLTLPCEKETEDIKETCSGQEKRESTNFLKKYPVFMVMIAGSMILMAVYNVTNIYLLQILQSVGGDSSHLGTALAISSITEVPILFLFSKIVKRIRNSTLVAVSAVFYTLKCLVFLQAGTVWMIYAAQLLQPFSYALYCSASVYFANDCVEAEDSATGQSFLTMSTSVGSVVGSLVGGWLIDIGGMQITLALCSAAAAVSAVVLAGSILLYRKSGGKN